MANLSAIIKQLMAERDGLNAAISTLQNIDGASHIASVKRTVSALARRRMAAAQRARWAKVKAKKG